MILMLGLLRRPVPLLDLYNPVYTDFDLLRHMTYPNADMVLTICFIME